MKLVAYTIKKFGDHRERRDYSKTKNKVALGNLLEIQKDSYEEFITKGIEEVLTEIPAIQSKTAKKDMQLMQHLYLLKQDYLMVKQVK